MALKSTVFKASLHIADIDHGYYADHALTLARHPSETDARLMARLVALVLNAHLIKDWCGGDATLAFGAGLSDPQDPDVHLTDFTGRKRLWVEVGQPEAKPLSKACSQADAVRVYAYGPAAEVWWQGAQGRWRGWTSCRSGACPAPRCRRWPPWPNAAWPCKPRCTMGR